MTRTNTVHTIEGTCLGDTAKASKFRVEIVAGEVLSEPKTEWFPISQIQRIIRAAPGSDELDQMICNEWILKQKGYLA